MKKMLCALLSTLVLLLAGCASPVEESASLDYEFVTPVRAIQISDVTVEDLDGPTKNINVFVTFVNRLDEESTIQLSHITLEYTGEQSEGVFPDNADEQITLAPQGKASTHIIYTIPDEIEEFNIQCGTNPYEHFCWFRYKL
jgi:hypothetical protein